MWTAWIQEVGAAGRGTAGSLSLRSGSASGGWLEGAHQAGPVPASQRPSVEWGTFTTTPLTRLHR